MAFSFIVFTTVFVVDRLLGLFVFLLTVAFTAFDVFVVWIGHWVSIMYYEYK